MFFLPSPTPVPGWTSAPGLQWRWRGIRSPADMSAQRPSSSPHLNTLCNSWLCPHSGAILLGTFLGNMKNRRETIPPKLGSLIKCILINNHWDAYTQQCARFTSTGEGAHITDPWRLYFYFTTASDKCWFFLHVFKKMTLLVKFCHIVTAFKIFN